MEGPEDRLSPYLLKYPFVFLYSSFIWLQGVPTQIVEVSSFSAVVSWLALGFEPAHRSTELPAVSPTRDDEQHTTPTTWS